MTKCVSLMVTWMWLAAFSWFCLMWLSVSCSLSSTTTVPLTNRQAVSMVQATVAGQPSPTRPPTPLDVVQHVVQNLKSCGLHEPLAMRRVFLANRSVTCNDGSLAGYVCVYRIWHHFKMGERERDWEKLVSLLLLDRAWWNAIIWRHEGCECVEGRSSYVKVELSRHCLMASYFFKFCQLACPARNQEFPFFLPPFSPRQAFRRLMAPRDWRCACSYQVRVVPLITSW